MKKKLKTISKLKKELDTWFSLYIRLRHADSSGFISCFTCGVKKHYKQGMQNGHFQSRKFMKTRFSELNCQSQCVGCNVFKYGEQFKFAVALDSNFGEGTAEALEAEARETCKMARYEYEEKITYYKNLVNNLKIVIQTD